jgi:hypothetical protein
LVLPIARLCAFGLQRHSLGDDAHRIFSDSGFHLLQKHFYLPIPDPEDLGDAFLDRRSELVGLEMNDEHGLALLDQVFPPFVEEFRSTFPLHSDGSSGFHLIQTQADRRDWRGKFDFGRRGGVYPKS